MSTFTFAPATREQAKARIALAGTSGSGKTYTALSLGCTLGDRVALIDTEHGSASKYAAVNGDDGFTFDALNLDNFDPRHLVQALAAAAQARYPVVVIDSLSHFWSGVGGMLEQADLGARKYGGNSFSGWKEARPMERQLIEAMLAYPGHVIVTMRTKTEYVIETDDRGKKVPKKVGMKPEQRDGIEYEFDIVGDMDANNTLIVSKSRCSALAGAVIPKPGKELAETVLEWLSGGAEAPDPMTYLDRAKADDLTYWEARKLFDEVAAKRMLGAAVVHPTTGGTVQLGEFIKARGKELSTPATDDAGSAA